MYYLCYRQTDPDLYEEIIPELKLFFKRVQHIKRTLDTSSITPYLNRIQRERCKSNLYAFEETAREFALIDNRDDFYLLYYELQRYLRLQTNDLRAILGREAAKRITLFI